MREELRKLPSVDKLLKSSEMKELLSEYGHELTVGGIRGVLDEVRAAIVSGIPRPTSSALVGRVVERVEELGRPTLWPVINATGVILHTNLGRAPLSEATIAAMEEAGRSYSNLEYSLETGERGSRYIHAERLLCQLTGAEAALLVNNNAGAVLLVLSALARGHEVIISRGQLVEIGGGFRIPDVMAQSGAQLVEVGTTNRTYIGDYANAINVDTALLMRVHTSNFHVSGFTHAASLTEMVDLAHAQGIPVVDDLGSGTLIDTSSFGLAHEPTVQESLSEGADLVTFSGDKLLGGPQAGIIVGRKDLIATIRHFPLTRALRVDKTTIAGVQANLLHYLKGKAVEEIPLWRMITRPLEEIEARAQAMARKLCDEGWAARAVEGRSAVGGGSLPGQTLPTWLVALECESPDDLAHKLRQGKPPVVTRIEEDVLLFDFRTVPLEQEEPLLGSLILSRKL